MNFMLQATAATSAPTADWWTRANVLATVAVALLTLVLVLIGIRGLRVLRLTKKDMLTRAQRESRSCAIKCCEQFADKIIPIMSPFLAGIRSVPVFVQTPSEIRFDPDPPAEIARAEQWIQTHLSGPEGRQTYGHAGVLLNQMEAWSMYLTTRLADSEVAYGPCGPLYCRVVVQLYPILLLIRREEHSGHYPNVVQLYKTWIAARENEAGHVRLTQIVEQLDELQARGPIVPYRHPPPLGTELDD